jgi:hypothetical protein
MSTVSEDILPVTCKDGHLGCHGDEEFVDEASAEGQTICRCDRIRGIHGRRVGCPKPIDPNHPLNKCDGGCL